MQGPGDDFIPFTIETYECFHSHFDSFSTVCAHTTIVCNQQSFLVPLDVFFYY